MLSLYVGLGKLEAEDVIVMSDSVEGRRKGRKITVSSFSGCK